MWDPEKYLAFGDNRGRPFFDLVARVGAESPRAVVDLGCGPGNLTETLALRWPRAELTGFDSSPEMVEAARARGVAAHVRGIESWQPADDTDVVISNAALQWVPGHVELLREWVRRLPSGAWIAVQVPGNFAAPSHRIIRELAREPHWRERLESIVLREDGTVLDPAGYAEVMADAGCDVDAWETTYQHRLSGRNPALEWVTGTALRPIRAALSDGEWADFRSAIAPRMLEAYPPRSDGTTWFSFRRIFFVARTP
ncbi:trans-aconitate 2-methyltransferase [Actinokineospora alba]|uniref:Trans-aconitate 2-methyltransferase n=1 Tax=Actinokineospora alba TaxID=504798 RepID=A0A1H0K4H2_9PSEU|nr:trans-aconitate 2-methyltransferase [Actinokineospora alba]TDP68059.1 trans-aconitate 2-methyltransferase [Actinokineospora alba]SDH91643.1 trans-aconitate 2-methyltransferase [Actinokineospora alba]SDO50571.1 trans-aconitate 2-methyltransferase [Actinokineospora alba]